MKRVKKLIRKINEIVENIDIQEVIDKMKADEENELSLLQNEIKISYEENNRYKISSNNKYNNYEEYNDFDMEEDSWTSLKAS